MALAVVATSLWALGCGGPLEEALQLEKAGNPEGAIAVYRSVLDDDPDNLAALSGEAVCLFGLHRYGEALVLQERVVALDPTDALTRVELGFNYLNHQDRPAAAVRVLAEAVALEPSGKNLVYLAQAQEGAGDASGAESTLRKAITVAPDYGYAYGQLVTSLDKQGRPGEAEEIRRQALARGVSLDNAL